MILPLMVLCIDAQDYGGDEEAYEDAGDDDGDERPVTFKETCVFTLELSFKRSWLLFRFGVCGQGAFYRAAHFP